MFLTVSRKVSSFCKLCLLLSLFILLIKTQILSGGQKDQWVLKGSDLLRKMDFYAPSKTKHMQTIHDVFMDWDTKRKNL